MADVRVAQIRRKRAVYLVLSTVTLLFLGLIYAFSAFKAPMVESFNVPIDRVGVTFNIMMITFCLGALLGSQIEKKVGVRGAIFSSAVMFAVGFIGTALFAQGNVCMIWIFYGAIGGLGVGIGYNSVIATTNVWFPDKVGLSSGILMMGFGLGALIIGSLISVPIYNATHNLSMILIALGIISAIVTGIEGILIQRPPADIVELMAPDKVSSSGYDPADEDKALKSPIFYVYWLWAIIVIAVGLATIGDTAGAATSFGGWLAAFASLLVGLVSALNGVGRVLVGIIYDKTDVKVTMAIDGIVAIVATLCIIAAFITNTPVLYIVGAFCCGFCYGGVPVVASAFGRQRFGAKNYPLNLSLCNFAIVFGSLLNLIIGTFVGVGSDHYLPLFIILFVLSILSLLDVIPFSKIWNRDQKVLAQRRQERSTEN